MTRRSAARRRSAAIVLQRPILKGPYGAIGNGAERSQDQGQNR